MLQLQSRQLYPSSPGNLIGTLTLQHRLGVEHPNTVTVRQNLALFWIKPINENRADLEVLQNNPLFVEIMMEFLAENLPDD